MPLKNIGRLRLQMLPELESNIAVLENPKTKGIDVFNFVFNMQYTKESDYNSIPEDTSLQRALKNHYPDGKYIYEYEGIFK